MKDTVSCCLADNSLQKFKPNAYTCEQGVVLFLLFWEITCLRNKGWKQAWLSSVFSCSKLLSNTMPPVTIIGLCRFWDLDSQERRMSTREHIQLEAQIATWPYRTSNVIKIRTTKKKHCTYWHDWSWLWRGSRADASTGYEKICRKYRDYLSVTSNIKRY